MENSFNNNLFTKHQDFIKNMNYNDAKSNNFAIVIPNMPEMVYFVKEVSLPTITQGVSIVPTNVGSDVKIAGDKAEYEDLDILMTIDEEFRVYESSLNWFKDTNPSLDCSRNPDITSPSGKQDIIIYVLSNNANPIAQFTFYGCFPLRVGNIEFDFTNPIDKMNFSMGFSVDRFDFRRL